MLNWLPDHRSLEKILPSLPNLSTVNDARNELRETPGLVPAAIDPNDETVIWVDLGQHELNQWQFVQSVDRIAKSMTGDMKAMRTNLRSMEELEADLGQSVDVAGFIFHMSRCGSTLLGNVLDASQDHLAINQPGPLQDGFWNVLTKNWSELPLRSDVAGYRSVFQHLIRAILRRRNDDPQRGFIKFRSWSVLFINFVRHAFPDVPCLFLYRDPADVIASTIQKSNVVEFGTLEQKSFFTGKSHEFVERTPAIDLMMHCYERYFRVILEAKPKGLKLLNYRHLQPDNLNQILQHTFGITSGQSDLEEMKTPFGYYSKDGADEKGHFEAKRDLKAKQRAIQQLPDLVVTPELLRQYERLERADNNLFSA